MLALLTALSITSAPCFPQAQGISSASAIINNMSSIRRSHACPDSLFDSGLKESGVLDANAFFSVLDHVSIKPGLVLDWVYYLDDYYGQPVIYARDEASPPYSSYSDYAGGKGKWRADARYKYLDDIQTDGTPEGYFQFIVLKMMGDQFCLSWHSNYNDERIICSVSALDEAIADAKDFALRLVEQFLDTCKWSEHTDGEKRRMELIRCRNMALSEFMDIQDKARKYIAEPTVEILDNSATVQILTFSKWGGLLRRSYVISNEFPHKILKSDKSILVPYNCNTSF